MPQTADEWVAVLSWPCFVLTLWYCLSMARAFRHGEVPLERLTLAILTLVSVAGFLLRPLGVLGVLSPADRMNGALITRVLFLIVMGGLVWAVVDHWSDRHRHR